MSSMPAQSNSQLAGLLKEAYNSNDQLQRELADVKARLEQAERIIAETGAGGGRELIEAIKRAERAEAAREDFEAERRAILEGWADFEQYINSYLSRIADAQTSFSRLLQTGALPQPPSLSTKSHRSLYSSRRPREESLELDGPGVPPAKKRRGLREAGQGSSSYHLEMQSSQILPQQQGPPYGLHNISEMTSSRSAPRSMPQRNDDEDFEEELLRTATSDPKPVGRHQTHIFAPPVTGAPSSRRAKPTGPSPPPIPTSYGQSPKHGANTNNIQETGTNGLQPLLPTETPSFSSPNFPPTNRDGLRICRQCGLPGRYRDGKCVEKWGPGPAGPGTVCDRCRKKMKRVERRGTLDAASFTMQSHNNASNAASQQHSSSGHRTQPLDRTATIPIRDVPTNSNHNGRAANGELRRGSHTGSSGSSSHVEAPPDNKVTTPPPTFATLDEQEQDIEAELEEELGLHVSDDADKVGHSQDTERVSMSPERHHLPSSHHHHGHPHHGTHHHLGDADGDADADADAEGELDAEGEMDADADAELLLAVDAAEAKSSGANSVSGGMKEEEDMI